MIVKHWEREDVRNQLLEVGAKYAGVIGRDIDNWRSLWTHLGRGYWIGCWHPKGREPKPLRGIKLGDQVHDVTEQFLPPEMTVAVFVNGFAGTQKQIPHIRIMKTETWPSDNVRITPRGALGSFVEVIGHRGLVLVGMVMEFTTNNTIEHEFAPPLNDQQSGTACLESGESGGPSFVDVGGDRRFLHGIHRGGGGQKGDRWIAGVDTWLGYPQVHDWIMGVIGTIEQSSVVEPEQTVEGKEVVVKIKPGQRVIVEVEE